MFTVRPEVNNQEVDQLFEEIFKSTPIIKGLRFALYSDDKLIGVASVSCLDKIILRAVGILPEYRKKGIGDFFTRSIMNGYTLNPDGEFYIGYISDYFYKFGFVVCDGMMVVKNSEIKFPSYCGKH